MTDRPPYVIHVEIPREASPEDVERVFDAVTEAAEEAAGLVREWDLFITAFGPRPRGES